MTASGSYAFADLEQIDFVTDAYERIGRAPSSLSSNDIDSARRSSNFLFMDWANDGPNLFAVEEFTIALTAGTLSYELPPEQVYILQAFTRVLIGDGPAQDLIISPISRAEYAALPYKSQLGQRPTQFYLQRTITPELFLWPVTEFDDTVVLHYYAMKVQQDAGAFTNSLDAPNRWMEAIAAGLAVKLAQKFAPERLIYLEPAAATAYARAKAEDRERVPLRVTIDMTGYSL